MPAFVASNNQRFVFFFMKNKAFTDLEIILLVTEGHGFLCSSSYFFKIKHEMGMVYIGQ